MLTGWVWRNDGLTPAVSQPVAEPSGIVGTIRDQPFWGRYAGEQSCRPVQVVRLSGGQRERQRAADGVGQGVNFGRPSAA